MPIHKGVPVFISARASLSPKDDEDGCDTISVLLLNLILLAHQGHRDKC